jgi:hypothetical protein
LYDLSTESPCVPGGASQGLQTAIWQAPYHSVVLYSCPSSNATVSLYGCRSRQINVGLPAQRFDPSLTTLTYSILPLPRSLIRYRNPSTVIRSVNHRPGALLRATCSWWPLTCSTSRDIFNLVHCPVVPSLPRKQSSVVTVVVGSEVAKVTVEVRSGGVLTGRCCRVQNCTRRFVLSRPPVAN